MNLSSQQQYNYKLQHYYNNTTINYDNKQVFQQKMKNVHQVIYYLHQK